MEYSLYVSVDGNLQFVGADDSFERSYQRLQNTRLMDSTIGYLIIRYREDTVYSQPRERTLH